MFHRQLTDADINSDSAGVTGNPPCRRCVEHQLECVLAKSRRGGRRIKGVKGGLPASNNGGHGHGHGDISPSSDGQSANRLADDEDISSHRRQPDQHRQGQEESEALQGWPSPQSVPNWRGESPSGSTQDLEESRRGSDGLEGHIASTDLLNPSDALDLLAQVADLDPGGHGNSSGRAGANSRSAQGPAQGAASSTAYFPPIADGILTWSEVSYLLKRSATALPLSSILVLTMLP